MDAFAGFMPKRNWFEPVEILNLDRSMETFKEGEAQHIETDADHQAFLFGFYGAVQVAIAMASVDDDPLDPDKFSDENIVTVEEFRAALRSAVIDGVITSKEARSFTWDTAQKMLEAKGQSLVGLSQEIRAAEVYVSDPVRYSSPTREDWEGIINAIRAGQDRKRETIRKRSWETLKNHLEEICKQALDAAKNLRNSRVLDTQQSREEFGKIVGLLSTVPKLFRRLMFCKRICGTKHFMRMPVVANGTKESPIFEPLKILIPMYVQAAQPTDCFWLLAFKNDSTGRWEHQIPASFDEIHEPGTILDLTYEELSAKATDGDPDAKHFLALISTGSPENIVEAWKESKITKESLQEAFSPIPDGRSTAWSCAIRQARDTFGWDLAPDKLSTIMGLSKGRVTKEITANWKFPLMGKPLKPVGDREFKKLFNKLKKSERPPDYPEILPADPKSLEDFIRRLSA